jgi:hypothetical protein
MGKALKSGYQSNYVLTDSEGRIHPNPVDYKEVFDEIILSLESQVVPVYLVYTLFCLSLFFSLFLPPLILESKLLSLLYFHYLPNPENLMNSKKSNYSIYVK